MTILCPCCRASNETATCRRCKADLSLLVAVEARRGYLVESAGFDLAEGKVVNAESALQEAAGLRAGDDLTPLRAVASLLSEDYAGAWRQAMGTDRGG